FGLVIADPRGDLVAHAIPPATISAAPLGALFAPARFACTRRLAPTATERPIVAALVVVVAARRIVALAAVVVVIVIACGAHAVVVAARPTPALARAPVGTPVSVFAVVVALGSAPVAPCVAVVAVGRSAMV